MCSNDCHVVFGTSSWWACPRLLQVSPRFPEHPLVRMDCSQDERPPWERAEKQEVEFVGVNSVAAQGDERLSDKGNTADNDEPTAVHEEEPTALEQSFEADLQEWWTALEQSLPLSCPSPQRARPEAEAPRSGFSQRSDEGNDGTPTALRGVQGQDNRGEQTETPMQSSSSSPAIAGSPDTDGERAPKRVRLLAKTTVAEAVVPPLDIRLPPNFSDECCARRAFHNMTGTQQYNYGYEKVRCFYIWHVHRIRLASDAEREAWDQKSCGEKQKDCDLVSSRG